MILHKDFASVVGVRRIGKTSLVRVSFNDLKDNIIPLSINLGRLNGKNYSVEDFSRLFLEGVTDLIKNYTFVVKLPE
ncbi:hypothetical protein [Acidianus manzaensis]|uniref:AAA domain-containing protein n=1 Tax=Acidianus manzaensis TaxID=282676 RepID=A0A1W6K3E6_9CREN|nr:hypothetical protein [Acidianus manzaensis]ARM76964.1 hypothetical protein B6F84_13685 [Acidianus manzaensis]